MILVLRISDSSDVRPGENVRQVFTEQGGTIGRAATNSWVLTHNKVSGRHATIAWRGGVFYIQDTSRNGISINTRENRIARERPHPLHAGDTIFIEPYVIDVSVETAHGAQTSADDPFAGAEGLGTADPFAQVDPFARSVPAIGSDVLPHDDSIVDPLAFFPSVDQPAHKRTRPAPTPSSDELLDAHVDAPRLEPDTPADGDPGGIPKGYNPLAPDDSAVTARPRPRPGNVAARHLPPAPPSAVPVESAPTPRLDAVEPVAHSARAEPPPAPVQRIPSVPDSATSSAAANRADPGSRDIALVMAHAGVPDAVITPELAAHLGHILRVVVSGLMDVLQARHRIKDEFRMRPTIFRPAENNPLKFSVNVDDALHNLFVKRNPAYLPALEAFSDAFSDLRHHEIAMLTGMRVAFNAMLAELDPDHLQEDFDRQLSRAGLPLVPARMRYWEMFRDKRREMVKDPEAAFSELFGEEFARGYEEQFRALKTQGRQRRTDGPPEPSSED